MITRKELISSKEYWLVKFQSALYEQVEKYLVENKISKTDFSKKLGVSKGYVSQILNGDFDHKISKFIELSLAIEKIPFLKFENLDKCVFLDSIGALDAAQESKISINVSINFTKHIKIEKQESKETVLLKKSGTNFPVNYGGVHLANQFVGLS
jgi:transcriptional regulator with XRE-family HTH domain